MLANYKLVIFDLDGTLYEGTDHFDYYAEKLKAKVDQKNHDDFTSEYEKMKKGKHIVSIGKAYDVKQDLVLTVDPMTLMVSEAHRWDGECVPEEEISVLYPETLEFNFKDMIAIGDGWWLPFVTAKHYGVEDCYPSYVATKEYMVTDQFTLEKLEGLREGLTQLKQDTQTVLVTNSDKDDVGRLLQELDLTDVFDHVVTSAQKPAQTTAIFKELLQQYEVDAAETVSIGDNFINEIAPALLLGMKGYYINPHDFKMDHHSLTVIPSVTACFQ
ncbi:HAD family hydrolase [Alkalihalobacillus sp. MEB130]|uniref:HAD family hydrolase n=1 Tax=Alkalihalobacillus sp. MEB130 TaxID=2976704 RepID=UPI0028E00DD1|nr:HAD family hydrolase [Alkalihalobacillus sp. MEB130]MDT8859569.1 HAD family hydrolase [Alkalihalobacillus sp. MEB130]